MAGIIDCNNDKLMVQEGLRAPLLTIDKRVFMKTEYEKNLLKTLKTKKCYPPAQKPKKVKNIRLTIHLKNEKHSNTLKNTYSFIVPENSINIHLNKFKDRIIKYYTSNVY